MFKIVSIAAISLVWLGDPAWAWQKTHNLTVVMVGLVPTTHGSTSLNDAISR